MEDGKEYILRQGMSYHVSDDLSLHRTYTGKQVLNYSS